MGERPDTLAGILAAVAAVAVPASLVAHLKLRRRDLSAILEASGWAINAHMRLTRRQADYFTCVPGYPSGARGIRSRSWLVCVLLAAAIAITVVLMVVLNRFNFH